MINGLEGIPGSGKSYEAVVFHVLAALISGRRVVTNLPLLVEAFAGMDPAYSALLCIRMRPVPVLGTWDATRIDDKGNGAAFLLFPAGTPSLAAPSDAHVFGGVWDFYDTWRHADGRGPLFVIDECHNPFPKIGTHEHVVQYFKLHRHFNVDILFMTQNFREMNQALAGLIGMLIKVRKADILGRAGSYIRKVHAGYRGAVISTEERKYLPQYFPLYKSHTQGNSVAESAAGDVSPFIVKLRRFSRGFYLFTALFVGYAIWNWYSKPPAVARASGVQPRHSSYAVSPRLPASAAVSADSAPVSPVSPAVAAPFGMRPVDSDEVVPEPLAGKGLHLTGKLVFNGRVIYTFALSSGNARFAAVTSDDLVAMGYRWSPLTDCAGTLRWLKSAMPVICDAPSVAQGSSNLPVVIALPAGANQPSARSDGLGGHPVSASLGGTPKSLGARW
jgi:zona occludens toxin